MMMFAISHLRFLVFTAAIVAAGNGVVGSQSMELSALNKNATIEKLISEMSIEDLVLQLHLMFADDIVGKNSNNDLYDEVMSLSPKSPLGVMHDWYPMEKEYYNSVQKLQFEKSHLKVPMMLLEECLHGVGSFKQSIFPQNIAMSASWDTDIVYRVGRAIGTEARSIGVVGCYSPVLDLGQDPRWGRVQEAFGEDKVLTSHMGVAYSTGLSKNKTWSDSDAVFPVMKHFAAHGAAQGGHNTAPFTGLGWRQILEDMIVPFKAVFELGGARGTMIAYNEIDGVPNAVNSLLYQQLTDMNYDGFTIADDGCVKNLITVHQVADSEADALTQWFNAGGMIDYYDFDLHSLLNTTKELVSNGSVPLKTLQGHVRQILGVKWDAGLFQEPYIPDDIDPAAIVESHVNLALEAAHKSIVLLKNDNNTLPLSADGDRKIALIGPFADTVNLGDYSGTLGQAPIDHASTLREAMLAHLSSHEADSSNLLCSWGSNSWEYNNQYAVPPYLLSSNGTTGGLRATYYGTTNFTNPKASRVEVPFRDWGLYPPFGLTSNNFSVVWEGQLHSPTDESVKGWIGIGVGANTTAKLYLDGNLVAASGFGDGDILGNIEPLQFIQVNSTLPPDGGTSFTFTKGKSYDIRIEYQTWNLDKKYANVDSVNSQVLLWWNLVSANGDAISQAVTAAKGADVIVMALGAAWNSDGEGGDRSTLGLAPDQEALAQAIYQLGKPVVLVLQGGRPFAIPAHYNTTAAVLNTFFGGQAAGQAISDVLFGKFNPGGRMPLTVPYDVGQLPIYYNYKPSAHSAAYLDLPSTPAYPFGYGLSYSNFSTSTFTASSQVCTGGIEPVNCTGSSSSKTFSAGHWIEFSVKVKNEGTMSGSYVTQVYLLGRVSVVTQPVKQLVAFERVYLDAGEETTVTMSLEVDRYLMLLNRQWEWELEKTQYTFALLENGGSTADTSMNVTMTCV